MRHFILDGHNILHKEEAFKHLLSTSESERAMHLLLTRSLRVTAGKNVNLTVVFDGYPPEGKALHDFKSDVRFSRNRKADDMIKSLIGRSKNPHNLVIVSDDMEIIRYARAHSCSIQSPGIFLKHTSAQDTEAGGEKPNVNDISINEWLKIFRRET